MSFNESLDNARKVLGAITQTPYCAGTIHLDPAMAMLFYTKDGKVEAINFTSATTSQLGLMAEVCHQETSGLDNTIVADESHTSGMDPLDFACQFSPWASGIVDIVKDRLLIRKHGVDNGVQVVLSKLNVYGPGPFFKAHVNTPRSETAVASLVVILPTKHEGGSMIIRHEGQEHVVDNAQAVVWTSHPTPHAAFVAFYSDVEHEVAPVTLGYRVTLTYNIHLTEPSKGQACSFKFATIDSQRLVGRIDQLKTSINTLLSNPTFLPEGGFLGFGLSHTYPFQTPPEDPWFNLASTVGLLKGTDAEVKRLCEALRLSVSLQVLYSEQRETARHPCCLTRTFHRLNFNHELEEEEDGNVLRLLEDEGATAVYPYDFESFNGWEWLEKVGKPIVYFKPFEEDYTFKEPYVVWGDDPHMANAYCHVCLVAVVGKASERFA